MGSKVRILSIDGGGIRGIIPAVIIAEFEKRIARKIENLKVQFPDRKFPSPRIGNYIDFIAGTSTGGILSCTYLIPDEKDPTEPRFSSKEALELYEKNGHKIFSKGLLHNMHKINVFSSQLYPAGQLERILEEYFQNTLLSQLIKPCLITAYNFYERRSVFFNSEVAKRGPEVDDFLVKDIARATSAAPTYFSPAKILSKLEAPSSLIDGGLVANNPALCAYSEARDIDFSDPRVLSGSYLEEKPVKPSAKDMLIVSLGTGTVQKRYRYSELKDAGMITWVPVIIDVLMSANSETVDYHLKKIYGTLSRQDKNDYYRLQPGLGEASPDMDNASDNNIKNLKEAALIYITENNEEIDEIVDKLIENS